MTPTDAMALKAYLKEKLQKVVEDRLSFTRTKQYTEEQLETLENLATFRLKEIANQEYLLNDYLDQQLAEFTKQSSPKQ